MPAYTIAVIRSERIQFHDMEPGPITRLLNAWSDGQQFPLDDVMPAGVSRTAADRSRTALDVSPHTVRKGLDHGEGGAVR